MYLLPIKGKAKKDSAQFDQDFYSANIMSENKKPQLKRKAISLEKKIQVLDCLDTGEGASAVGKFFDLNKATVRTIKKNQDRIRSSVAAGTAAGSKKACYAREVVLEMMEKALVIWIEDNVQQRIPIMLRYNEMYKNISAKKKQPLISKFLKKL
jgi:hypothetical protein